ncbi:uncharacterized protein [Patagioenas fasciata]|uniref:uncharacterized protein isoform X2 n=1 Tax=Patagioenas fasciata TaxID=372321 RepID=UPI003A9A63BB
MKDNHLLKTRPVEGGGLEAACGQRIHQMYSRDLAMLQVRGQTRSWGDISECTGAPGTIGTVRQRKATSFPKRSSLSVLTSLKITVQERKPWITAWRRAQASQDSAPQANQKWHFQPPCSQKDTFVPPASSGALRLREKQLQDHTTARAEAPSW